MCWLSTWHNLPFFESEIGCVIRQSPKFLIIYRAFLEHKDGYPKNFHFSLPELLHYFYATSLSLVKEFLYKPVEYEFLMGHILVSKHGPWLSLFKTFGWDSIVNVENYLLETRGEKSKCFRHCAYTACGSNVNSFLEVLQGQCPLIRIRLHVAHTCRYV